MTIYIAGPMTGRPNYNYDEFNEHAKLLREDGDWGDVINPAEGFGGDQDLPRGDYLRAALKNLSVCDAIYLLDGWETSEGALMELAIANTLGLKRIFPEQGTGYTKGGLAASVGCRTAVESPTVLAAETLLRSRSDSAAIVESDPFTEELDAIKTLHDAKKHDYTGGQHPLANYAFSASMVGLPPYLGMFQRMCEKVYRIHALTQSGSEPVVDESLTDTLRDIAIIAILMRLSLSETAYGMPFNLTNTHNDGRVATT